MNSINKTDATCTFPFVRPLLGCVPPPRRRTRCRCIVYLGFFSPPHCCVAVIFPKIVDNIPKGSEARSSSDRGTNLRSWGRTTVAVLRSSGSRNGPASALIDPRRTPLGHSTFPSTRRRTSNGRSARGRDYDALAGLAVEREIRGLKELCSDRGHFAYRRQTVNRGTVPNR